MRNDVECIRCHETETFYGSSFRDIEYRQISKGWVSTSLGDVCQCCFTVQLESKIDRGVGGHVRVW